MLRGLLFLPESQTKRPPLVIMAHGTSATVYMVADKYAEAFSRAGLAVLLYDHRNFGRSEGEPRQGTNPWIQCRGYRDAVKLVERLNGVDPERIALWGGQLYRRPGYRRRRDRASSQGHRRIGSGIRCGATGSRPEQRKFRQHQGHNLAGKRGGVDREDREHK